jgi:hypothetical protein
MPVEGANALRDLNRRDFLRRSALAGAGFLAVACSPKEWVGHVGSGLAGATVLIPQFATIYTTDYGAQAAAAVVMTLPLVLLVLFFQKKIVSGLTAGATKE